MARNLVRFNPLAELDALQRQFFGDDVLSRFRGPGTPTTDVYTEGDKQLTVEAHLPNFDRSDIDISVDEGALVVQAEKHEREEDKNKKYVVRESSTSFYRRVALPDSADEDNITAEFDNGVLKVVVPFKEVTAAKRKIAIKGSGDQAAVGAGDSGSKGDS